ncbi:MAG: hypothetical protein GY842_20510 [bacterium]|nr:hypothetical protein [bacterium]
MSKLRGLLQIVSLLAILHLVVLGGLGAYWWSSGTLSTERVDLIAAVLRGELDPPAEDDTDDGPGQRGDAETAQVAIAQEQMEEETERRQLERDRAELDQRLELVLREMHRVQQEREYFEDRRRLEAESVKRKSEQSYREGFDKQLQLFGTMKPKVAVEYLLSRSVAEAAELIRAMDTRKGRKIIEAARTPNQRKKMDEILKLLPDLEGTRASAAQTG